VDWVEMWSGGVFGARLERGERLRKREAIFGFEINGDEEESGLDVGFMLWICAAEGCWGRRRWVFISCGRDVVAQQNISRRRKEQIVEFRGVRERTKIRRLWAELVIGRLLLQERCIQFIEVLSIYLTNWNC